MLFALMNNMLSNRFFRVFLGYQCSRWRRLNNGLPDYLSDIPSTTSKLFQYADDIAMTFQSSYFEEFETSLESDLIILNQFLRNWHLQPNPSKSKKCVFHLGTHDANRRLKIQFDNTDVQHVNMMDHHHGCYYGSNSNIQNSSRISDGSLYCPTSPHPKLRRSSLILKNSWIYEKSILSTELQAVPPLRLRS
jgi:hypothetical protein